MKYIINKDGNITGKSFCEEIEGIDAPHKPLREDESCRWNGSEWEKFRKNEDENSDANTYRRNSYRVLLTRGRDGFIVFVPPVDKLDSVYELLLSVGIKELN